MPCESDVELNDIREAILSVFGAELPTLDLTAKKLTTSARTLQRTLKAKNTTYTKLLQETLFKKARSLLSKDSLSLKEISILLGYQDPSNFSRAFKNWSGELPSAWREKRTSREIEAALENGANSKSEIPNGRDTRI